MAKEALRVVFTTPYRVIPDPSAKLRGQETNLNHDGNTDL